ncbi:peptidase M50 [Pseudomonas sp. M47T1]|uniref:DUF4347 domain-containing protein n=1 Tax=Pseudomonas sp. M47T1 TaxID=1179778 RepID=UPI000260701D|nr:DUF4347 domain-containing protein [Pseudomonas sp. M47T1]EIK94286.1 peptidase M50 [Pseudomonas sp. M47T1]
MSITGRLSTTAHLRPHRQALALEPRILFDGAAATAATDQHHVDAPTTDAAHATTTDPAKAATDHSPAPSATRALLVIDSRVENRDQLLAQLPSDVKAIVVNTSEDGLAVISAALAQLGKVDSIQVISHGAAGQFTLGNRTVSADNVDQLSSTLEQWRASPLIDPRSWQVDAYVAQDRVHLITAGAAVRFYPDGQASAVTGHVLQISSTRAGQLSHRMLSSHYGGPVPAPSAEHPLVPGAALFQVRIQLDEPLPSWRETRGHLKIEGEQRSLLADGATHLLAVLMRESGF